MTNSTNVIIEELKNHIYNEDFGSVENKNYFLKAIAELEKLNTEIKFYRDYIHNSGLEFDAMNQYATWLKLQ